MDSANINWTAYQQGFDAWERYCDSEWSNKADNPYECGSDNWRSWNVGWNSNQKGITK